MRRLPVLSGALVGAALVVAACGGGSTTPTVPPVNVPSLAIPSGFTRNGLPVGMQLIGRSFDEAMLLRIGAAFQRATDFHARVPVFA